MAKVFPDAEFFALFVDDFYLPQNLKTRVVHSGSLQWLPWKYRLYRYLLPLYPLLFESIDLKGYDVVITSDSCVAKCVLVDQSTVHICYCHSPMRCLYDQYRIFLSEFSLLPKLAFYLATHYVRIADFVASQRVDCMIGNSEHIAERIMAYYGCESTVIYPPVSTHIGYISSEVGDYYLSVGRLTTPKRIDLLIGACNLLQRRLVIVGSGRDTNRLKKMSGKTIEFRGRVSNDERSELYAHCRALLFAPDEDFGIVPVEAQAHGRPVIAYRRGGSLETVIENVTGIFFEEQTAQSLADAILKFEAVESSFDPHIIQRHAQRFGGDVFEKSFKNLVSELLANRIGVVAATNSYGANSALSI